MTVQSVLDTLGNLAGRSIDTLDQTRFLTPAQSEALLVAAVLLVGVPIIDLWIRGSQPGKRGISLASLSIPCVLLLLLQVPQGLSGLPDDNCDRYDNGRLIFTLIKGVVVPRRSDDLYGDDSLILLVRASQRWGDVPHQCRLPLSSEKAKQLMKVFSGFEEGSPSRWSRGVSSFSLGGTNEEPNVKYLGHPPAEKSAPPEAPPQSRRDA